MSKHANRQNIVGFGVLSAVVMKISVFWDITPCTALKVNSSFGGTRRLHLQGRPTSQARNQCEADSKQSLAELCPSGMVGRSGNLLMKNTIQIGRGTWVYSRVNLSVDHNNSELPINKNCNTPTHSNN
jgi:hypothetical protein